jgi:hypothetical protein
VIRKERFSAIATRAWHLSGVGGPAVGLWEGQPNPDIPYPATQLEKDPKPSKSLVRETRLAGEPC